MSDREKAVAQLLRMVRNYATNDELRQWFLSEIEMPEVVRCRNCRHYNTECCTDGFGWCEHRDFGTNDEWYCADGEVN